MGDVIYFKRSGIDGIDALLDRIEAGGLTTSIIRNAFNWQGDLAFSFTGLPITTDAMVAAHELYLRFVNDKALRLQMYEEAFSIGALYYEASTSKAVAFHENQMPMHPSEEGA